MDCNIIQDSKDGLGHQLYGLFSLIILEGCKKDNMIYKFDGHSFKNKVFQIEHQSSGIEYMKEIADKFNHYTGRTEKKYSSIQHAHEIYKIPQPCDQNVLYSLDNAYYFKKVNLDNEQEKKRDQNILNFRDFFINDNLPPKRHSGKIIVIHTRLGDSVNRDGNKDSRKDLLLLVREIESDFPEYTIHIHSDGNPKFLKGTKRVFHSKETPVMDVISDMIHADILICGVSSLSYFCSFLSRGELILVPDGIPHSVPKNSITFSQYLSYSKDLEKLGTDYGGWYVPKNIKLDENSIVYSGGVGEDISFDLIISDKFKSKILLIDPTKRAKDHYVSVGHYYKTKNMHVFKGDIQPDYEQKIKNIQPDLGKIEFLDLGLWDFKSELKFFKPDDEKYVSHTLIDGMFSKKYEIVHVDSIKNIMSSRGDSKIDLLKLDIEGAEIRTINQMLDDQIFPRYILVEFDLYLKGKDPKGETKKLINRLKKKYHMLKDDNMNLTFSIKGIDL
jgi:FkbM family methyltransferase